MDRSHSYMNTTANVRFCVDREGDAEPKVFVEVTGQFPAHGYFEIRAEITNRFERRDVIEAVDHHVAQHIERALAELNRLDEPQASPPCAPSAPSGPVTRPWWYRFWPGAWGGARA